ncbi:MAG: ATP synthase subunit gamma, membrane-bound, F1 sector [Candidatus Rokubacteria bacterium CSP1-6]|nr:MAG: ATP synthase subunit gamma, membrane-bound, F1 sector [Candidatus Rokubacteria bacterium CSP1-6]
MATLRDIRRRIRAVQSTQKITRAMKLVAAAKLRRAQERILEARPYAHKMSDLLGNLALRTAPERHPLLARREGGRRQIVIITADKGLCGAFNTNVIRRSLEFIRQSEEASLTLVVVGRKARDHYRRRSWTVKSEMLGFFDRLAYSHAAELSTRLIQDYLTEETDEIHLIYNEFRSVSVQRVVREQLLPITPAAVPADAAVVDYLYEPSADAILAALLPRHVTIQAYRALMESLAAEYGARMTAMEAATKNASEMIDLLTIQYNKARQERITKELLDIVGGAEALRQSAEA